MQQSDGVESLWIFKQVIQRGRRREKADGVITSLAHPELPGSSSPEGYAENCDEPRMKLGKRRVLARRGWAGEKVSLFSILLTKEDPFKVIPKRKDHDAH